MAKTVPLRDSTMDIPIDAASSSRVLHFIFIQRLSRFGNAEAGGSLGPAESCS